MDVMAIMVHLDNQERKGHKEILDRLDHVDYQ